MESEKSSVNGFNVLKVFDAVVRNDEGHACTTMRVSSKEPAVRLSRFACGVWISGLLQGEDVDGMLGHVSFHLSTLAGLVDASDVK